nr:hypothetical protein [Tanacetum cinerariifolium]
MYYGGIATCTPEGYAEAIVVPQILAEQFELKHSLINMMTSNLKRTILLITSEDLVSKFINEFFPSSRTTNLRNEISNFQQRFDESFYEAWDRYKDLLRACPHYGFTELHQIDTFYNALNPADQDSLNYATGGNLLERRTQDVLTIIKNKSKHRNYRRSKQPFILEECLIDTMADQCTMAELLRAPTEGYAEAIVVPQILAEQFELKHSLINMMTSNLKRKILLITSVEIAKLTHAVNKQTSAVTTAMTAILKQFQATPLPASVKAVEEICVTCGGAHLYYQCLAAGGNTFPELRDNIQGYIQASMSNQTNEIKNMIASLFQMNTASTSGSGSLPSNTIANPKGKLKAITTRSGLVLDRPTVPTLPPFINPKVDERVEETLTDLDLSEYTIKISLILQGCSKKQQEKDEVQIHKFWQMFKQLHINITLTDALILMPKYQKMLKSLLSNKEKLQELANTPHNENCSAVILKKLPEKLGDLGKFLIPCGFSELKCKALANLGASINLMPLSIWKKLGLPELISTRMTLELTNQAICTPAGIARDVFISVGKPFLRTARTLIDVHGEEMILRDGDERLTLNMRHDTSSYSHQPQKESIDLINVFNDSSEDFLEDLFSTNQPSGNPTFSSHPELTSSEVKNDIFDPEGGNVLPKKLLDLDSPKDLYPHLHVNQLSSSTTYSSSPNPLLEELVEVESDTENVYDDPFDSMGEKIKESKLLIDQLDLPCDFLISFEYDLILSEDFSMVDALPSTNNEDKVFNPVILIQENPFEIITRVVQDKKLAISNASVMLKDFDPPLYELPFFKEVPRSNMLLLFSSENKEKVFKPGIHTSGKVHSSLILKLSHQGYKVFKINQIFKNPVKIVLFSCGKDTHTLDVSCLHFYPLDQFKYRGIGSS